MYNANRHLRFACVHWKKYYICLHYGTTRQYWLLLYSQRCSHINMCCCVFSSKLNFPRSSFCEYGIWNHFPRNLQNIQPSNDSRDVNLLHWNTFPCTLQCALQCTNRKIKNLTRIFLGLLAMKSALASFSMKCSIDLSFEMKRLPTTKNS